MPNIALANRLQRRSPYFDSWHGAQLTLDAMRMESQASVPLACVGQGMRALTLRVHLSPLLLTEARHARKATRGVWAICEATTQAQCPTQVSMRRSHSAALVALRGYVNKLEQR